MDLCLGASTMLGFVATVATGTFTPPDIQTYIGVNYGYLDSAIELKNPIGKYGIEYEPTENIKLFFEHISSPVQCNDNPGINHLGVKFFAPVSEYSKLYIGVSAHDPGFDKKNSLSNPIISIGGEAGDDVKFYTEYLTDVTNFDNGRFGVGVKLFFK